VELASSSPKQTPRPGVHQFLGDAIMWLAGLHSAAALYHHFMLKDGVLATMLPGKRPR